MKPSTKANMFALLFSAVGTLSSAVWNGPILGGILIGFAVMMLAASFICESIERRN